MATASQGPVTLTSHGPATGGGSSDVRGETATIVLTKRSQDQAVGLDLGYSKDKRWLVIAAVQPGSLAAQFKEIKAGSKLLDIKANGQFHPTPSLQAAVTLLKGAEGELQLTIMPLLDRYGFIVSSEVSSQFRASHRVAAAPRSRVGVPSSPITSRHNPRRAALVFCRSNSPATR